MRKDQFFLTNPTLIYIYVKPHKRVIKVIFKEKIIINFIYWIYLVKLNFLLLLISKLSKLWFLIISLEEYINNGSQQKYN